MGKTQCMKLIEQLYRDNRLTKEEYKELLWERFSMQDKMEIQEVEQELFSKAREVQQKTFGKKVFVRGLIEFTNYCCNNCYYCGIRCDNTNVERYRLTKEQILDCCLEGYELGYRTFVLQGGEDIYFTDEKICDIVSSIKANHPDVAVTLSVGERSYESYKRMFDAGADRYLLRHETATEAHYNTLHPREMSLQTRKECLKSLRDIGYQVGAGIMVGSPGQTLEHIAEDFAFLLELQPHMIGIGPYISHKDTPFANEKNGSVEQTLFLLGMLRLTFPKALLPSTTALGTLDDEGREKGILAGGNVLMPNLSPLAVRRQYTLYDNKISTGDESAQSLNLLKKRIEKIGYEIVVDRGDYPID